MVCDISPSKDAPIHQIWDSYLKLYRRYTLDMIILETRSRSQWPQNWNMALCHPKMQPHTKVGIPTSNNMRFAQAVIHLQFLGLAVTHINESNWKITSPENYF